jgi:hypothetical protein
MNKPTRLAFSIAALVAMQASAMDMAAMEK